VLVWLSVWGEVQIICILSRRCHCHRIMSCLVKIQIGLTFLVPAYPGCLQKEPIKWASICLWCEDLNGIGNDNDSDLDSLVKRGMNCWIATTSTTTTTTTSYSRLGCIESIRTFATRWAGYYRPITLPVAKPTASKAVVPCYNKIMLKNFSVARNHVWNEIKLF